MILVSGLRLESDEKWPSGNTHKRKKERTDSWIRERFKGFEKEERITVCGRLQSRPFSVFASRLLN